MPLGNRAPLGDREDRPLGDDEDRPYDAPARRTPHPPGTQRAPPTTNDGAARPWPQKPAPSPCKRRTTSTSPIIIQNKKAVCVKSGLTQ